MTIQRCRVPFCYGWVPDGEKWCSDHHPENADPDRWAEAFRTRILRGDHAGLIGADLRELLAVAASDRTLTMEIGILRLALIRVLVTEKETERLATTASRLVSVLVQAARARHTLVDQPKDPATLVLNRLISGEEEPT
ncbi:MAG: hypothetical protein ACRDJW_07585 [Thermomicrobiales bacterium]